MHKQGNDSALLADLLTIEQIAAATRRTPGSIYVDRHRNPDGIGALGVKVGRRLLWRRADVDAWFERQLREAG